MPKTKEDRHTAAFVTDVVMLVLISINLLLILFEWFYSAAAVQDLFASVAPAAQQLYHDNIHEHFFWIDLGFIAIYLTEILVQWVVAAWKRTYGKWWYYPFVHWYDVLGCIPIASFRFFRLLRVFSLIVKMQRLNVIDLTQSFFYKGFVKYWALLTEEITDHVVLNILGAVQEEVQLGSPVTEEIGRRVIQPKREALVEALSFRLQHATAEAYKHYRPDVRRYVDTLVSDAVEQNQELKLVRKLPIVGKQLSDLLTHAISDIGHNVVHNLIEDVASAENKAVVHHMAQILADTLLATDGKHDIDRASREAIIDSLEVIKEHVEKKKERDDLALKEEARRLAGSVVREVHRPDQKEGGSK